MRRIIFFLIIDLASSICSLCSHENNPDVGVDGLVHPAAYTDSKGKTCANLMVDLFRLDAGDPVCVKQYKENHKRCCHIEGDSDIPQDPPPPPPQFSIDGPFKKCDLCLNGSYPTATGMVINMLYIGVGSCVQYYQLGQRGWIQNHLCAPLQFFARDPCGCPV